MKLCAALVFFCFYSGRSQCDIISQVQPNGTVHKVTKQEVLYVTKSYTLYSAARYDGNDYFFELVIRPVFFKKVKKEHVALQLDNGPLLKLEFYDFHRLKKDSAMDILFEIGAGMLPKLTEHDLTTVTFVTDSVTKKYNLVDNRGLLRRQLSCIEKSNQKKK